MPPVFDHPILLRKLELYGVEECALSWINIYLSNRTQSVQIEGHLSNSLLVDIDLDRKYTEIAQYMDRNKLVLNYNKTHLMIMTSNRKHANH